MLLKWKISAHPFGYLLFYCFDGTRKAVKKTCRWHVFRPWESPSGNIVLFHSFPHILIIGHIFHAVASFLQVLAESYINLILFATIFYQYYSIFYHFLFCVIRQNLLFSNFQRHVMHSIHRFFHRFWRHFCCRTSLNSVFI